MLTYIKNIFQQNNFESIDTDWRTLKFDYTSENVLQFQTPTFAPNSSFRIEYRVLLSLFNFYRLHLVFKKSLVQGSSAVLFFLFCWMLL